MVAHVTRGEQVVPKPVLDSNPALAYYIAQAIRDAGADPEQYKVGSGMSYNPETGHPEFGFFSHGLGRILKTIAPIVVGAFNPLAGAAVGGALGASGGGGIIGGVTGAAGGYFGGSALSGAAAGFQGLPVAGTVGPTSGGFSGALAGAGSGASGAASSLGSALGISSGAISGASKVLQAASLFGGMGAPSQPQSLAQQKIGAPETPFSPKRPEAAARPSSLNELSNYSPEQERSYLATKGVNSGLGSEEDSYYRNLVQRSLIGEGNKVQANNPNALLPIEGQYFSQKGYNSSDIMQLLKGLQS